MAAPAADKVTAGSHEVFTVPELTGLFKPPPTQMAVTDSHYRVYLPDSTPTAVDQVAQFDVPPSMFMKDLSQSFVRWRMRLKYMDTNGALIMSKYGESAIAPLFPHVQWKGIRFSMGGVPVSRTSGHYQMTAFASAAISVSSADALSGDDMFILDDPSTDDTFTAYLSTTYIDGLTTDNTPAFANIPANKTAAELAPYMIPYNLGRKRRHEIMWRSVSDDTGIERDSASNGIDCTLRPFAGPWRSGVYMPSDLGMLLELIRGDDKFFTEPFANATPTVTATMSDMKLYVKQVEINPRVYEEFSRKWLELGEIQMPMVRTRTIRLSALNGSTSVEQDIGYADLKPSKVMVIPILDSYAPPGQYGQIKFRFYPLTTCRLNVNGQNYPRSFSFDTNGEDSITSATASAYPALRQGTAWEAYKAICEVDDPVVSRDHFSSITSGPMYCFDLRPYPTDRMYNPVDRVNITLNATFNNPGTTLYFYVVAFIDDVVQIKPDRGVIVNF